MVAQSLTILNAFYQNPFNSLHAAVASNGACKSYKGEVISHITQLAGDGILLAKQIVLCTSLQKLTLNPHFHENFTSR